MQRSKRIFKIRMAEGGLGSDSGGGVIDKHFLQYRQSYFEEVQAIGIEFEATHHLLDGISAPVGEGGLVLPQLGHSRPHSLVGGAQDPEYPVELIDIAVTLEEHLLCDHLRKYAANCPDVDGRGVFVAAQQELGGSVPQGYNFLRVGPDWQRVGSRETKVPDFEVF